MGEKLEMNADFHRCVESGKIIRFVRGKLLVKKELSTADSDLIAAKASLGNLNYKWATIQGYYAMFHGARALVYSKNYRERSHYCLTVAFESAIC